ncbi:hypothetical protein I7I53_01289 [Histoplasma capsulatum var. duboisii H88]|uniref:Uncharacterized protein n=1 Tax=Ajellomyces capsulatus (strain H88) TaxID=544711 RepID=A0A8A1LIP1_AJEC8|nr:hypothetical protein I7I53_01289 [Histoplasma capsulatum var. duboisii H88]
MKPRTIPSTSNTRNEAIFQAPSAPVERGPYNYIVRGPKHSNKSTQVAEMSLHSPFRRSIHMTWDTIPPMVLDQDLGEPNHTKACCSSSRDHASM